MTDAENLTEILFRAKVLIGTVANVLDVMPTVYAGVLAHAANGLLGAVETYTGDSMKDGENLGDMAMRDMFDWLRNDPDTPAMTRVIWDRMYETYPREQTAEEIKLDKIWEDWGNEANQAIPPVKPDGEAGVERVDKLDESGTDGAG